MSPVAQATNILQAETNAQMGWLLPNIHLLQVKLDKVKLHCKPLADALQYGIQNQFGHMFTEFQTTWTKDDATIKMGINYIKQHIEDPSMQPGDVTRSSSSDEDDFFSSLQALKTQDDAYLSCSADHMDLLKTFPSVCKLSVKLNTPLPASAASERLFSIAGLVFSPQRVQLNSRHFESQLLLQFQVIVGTCAKMPSKKV